MASHLSHWKIEFVQPKNRSKYFFLKQKYKLKLSKNRPTFLNEKKRK